MERRPVGGQHTGREIPARGVGTDDQTPSKPRQLTRRRPHLLDNLIDRDIGTKIVARNGHAHPMGIQPAGKMAEKGTVQRLPVAAMYENNDRAFIVARKQIDRVPLPWTVGNRTPSAPFAIGRRVARPAGDQRRVLRNPRPVVVFDLVVDTRAQDLTMLVLARISAPRPWSWPTDASIRGHPSERDPKIYRRSTSHVRRPSCEIRHGRLSST